MLHVCESLVQDGSKPNPRWGEPLVNDLDFLLVIVLVDLSAISHPSRLCIPVRLVRPIFRAAAGGQMLVGDQFLQMSDVCISCHARVLNESGVPSTVQIAWMPPAPSCAELRNGDPVPASRLPDCVHRLMHIADEVDEELQGFDAVIP